jgi:hypothetical protein
MAQMFQVDIESRYAFTLAAIEQAKADIAAAPWKMVCVSVEALMSDLIGWASRPPYRRPQYPRRARLNKTTLNKRTNPVPWWLKPPDGVPAAVDFEAEQG